MYQCTYFKIYELVPPDLFEKYEDNQWKLWNLFDDRALITNDQLREVFGKIIINDWHWGGNYKDSGFRTPDCKIGAEWSQHKFGRGFDLKFKDTDVKTVRHRILQNKQQFEFINSIELGTPTWLHFDTRNVKKSERILTFKP